MEMGYYHINFSGNKKEYIMISIIVPVYKVEKYLNNCIQSILHQTYKDFELLLIDDGSPDASGRICDDWAEHDKRIRVFHKKNGGLSDARNYGIDRANGEYILFIDSDDSILNDALEEFVHVIDSSNKEIDIVVAGAPYRICEDENSNGHKIAQNQSIIEYLTGADYLKKYVSTSSYNIMVCNKLYRREFLMKNSLRFEKGFLHEDELFTPIVLLKAQSVISFNMRFYNYLMRAESITTQSNKLKNVESIYKIVKKLDDVYDKIYDLELRKKMFDHSATIHYQALSKISKTEAKKSEVLDYALLKRHSYSMKNKIRYVLLKLNYGLFQKVNNRK